MEIKCPKCGSSEITISIKVKWDNINRETYNYLCPQIKPFMNNDSRGETVEIYHEFLLCNCRRCSGVFFKPTLDSDIGDNNG